MGQIIKLTESQLRGIIKETLGKILNENVYDEGRKRTRPSYYEIEDYRQVPGVDLCIKIDNLMKMKNPKNRNLDRLINFMMQNSDVLHLYIDEEIIVYTHSSIMEVSLIILNGTIQLMKTFGINN